MDQTRNSGRVMKRIATIVLGSCLLLLCGCSRFWHVNYGPDLDEAELLSVPDPQNESELPPVSDD